MNAIVKRGLFVQRQKMFISRPFVRNMVAAIQRGDEELSFGMLWLFAYSFLLRLPSEALPLRKCSPDSPMAQSEQSIAWFDGSAVCIRLRRRKNREQGSGVLRRFCTCKGEPLTCMVHAFWARFLEKLPDGACPWAQVTAGQARNRLHRILRVLKVPDAENYGTHDFRRGHADDMRRCGSTLAEILAAGQWKSSAFMNCINEADLQQEVAFAVAIESDVEDWID